MAPLSLDRTDVNQRTFCQPPFRYLHICCTVGTANTIRTGRIVKRRMVLSDGKTRISLIASLIPPFFPSMLQPFSIHSGGINKAPF